MAQQQNSCRRLRCNYQRLWAMKGIERLQNLVPNASKDDEVKMIVDAMFYVTQLENKAEQLRKSVKRARNKRHPPSATVTSSEEATQSQDPVIYGENGREGENAKDLPDDLRDLDEAELRQLYTLSDNVKQEEFVSEAARMTTEDELKFMQ